MLLTEGLGRVHHVGKSSLGLLPLARLETAVRVDPQLLGLEPLEHLANAVLHLLLGRDTRGVDVVHTGANVAGVLLVLEDLEQLSIALGVLDGQDIGVKSGDGVEEILELRVAEVRVNLGRVLDTSSRKLEGVDGPREVFLTLLAGTERKTLTESRLVDLDDEDTSRLKVNDLIADGEGKLLCLDGLVDVVTRERPSETGDGARKHTLHGLLGDGRGVLGLLDSHSSRAGDVTDNDRRTDTAGSVGLNPAVGSEGITVEALTEVLHHVVTLRLAMDKDIKVELLLDTDDLLDLLLDEALVLLGGDLTLGELVTLDTDLLGLGEGTNGGGGEDGKLEVSLLSSETLREGGLALVVFRLDSGLAVLDGLVVGALGGGARFHGLGVSLEGLTNSSGAFGDSLGNDSDLGNLLDSEGEPVSNLSVELLLGLKGVRSVEERAGSGDDHAVLAELLDGSLNSLNSTLEVGLPDVAAVNNTGRENLAGAKLANDSLELLWVSDKVDVDTVDALEAGEDIEVVDNVTKVGGEDDLGQTAGGKCLVSRLEGILDLLGEVLDEDRLVNLDCLGAGLLELLQKLNVYRNKLVEEGDGVDGLATVGLSEVEEGDGTDKDGAGGDTSLLGLEELANRLGVGGEGEGLVVLEGGLDVVVVGIEPLDHLEGGHIDTILLVATAHGEVLIERVKLVLGVALGDGLGAMSAGGDGAYWQIDIR